MELNPHPWAGRPLSWLYRSGRFCHRSLYSLGIRKRRRLPVPVLCVGNLSVGGTGKTPLLIRLVDEIRQRGRRPAILSRGYGATPTAREPRVVSSPDAIVCSAVQAGDEPYLLARACPGTPVVIGASRYEAGRLAMEKFSPDLFLPDDGFQHEALVRDFNLVLWDLRDVPSRTGVLPAGPLREGIGALRRASALILTHEEYVPEPERGNRRERVVQELKAAAPRAPVFEACSELTRWRRLQESSGEGSEQGPMSDLRARRVMLLSGLARPDGFETMVAETGIEVVEHLKRGDHARYEQADAAAIAGALERCGADLVLTTAKDAVKLESFDWSEIDLRVVELSMRIREDERWGPFLDSMLDGTAHD